MDLLNSTKFSFTSSALSQDELSVIKFDGVEGLSSLYRFEIDLASENADIDLESVLNASAVFTIIRDDGSKVPFHGMLAEFEQKHGVDKFYFYKAVLVPKLWWLTKTFHNQVFINQTPEEMIEAVLKDGGLTTLDFEFKLSDSYRTWDYCCQYGESHFNFVSRWMERNGMYYYFEQNPSGEKMIITDSKMAHTPVPNCTNVTYSQVSGLNSLMRDEIVQSFVCRRQNVPKNVFLKDYNYEKPSLDVSGQADVYSKGRGEMYIYGEDIQTPEEGNKLAKIRSEEYLCQQTRFYGESTVPYLKPGFQFNMEKHFRNDNNQKYLSIEINHKGNQASFLTAGLRSLLSEQESQMIYQNSFVAIPSGIQFRNERKTPKSKFSGTINAHIDASGSGKYAQIDDQGRYKVILPFDLSGKSSGKASSWIRMMQPYAGAGFGTHSPLHKGTEVLLTFIDGDPNRPIIAGAVPNTETKSPVTSANQTMCNTTTGGGNKIHIEDQEGSQRILMQSPTEQSFVRIGAHNDPDDPEPGANGICLSTAKEYKVFAGSENSFIIGNSQDIVLGNEILTCVGAYTDVHVGGTIETRIAYTGETSIGPITSYKLSTETEYGTVHEIIKADVTETIGDHTSTKAAEVKTALEAEHTIANHTKTIAALEKTCGEQVKTIATATNTIAALEQTAATKVELLASQEKTAASLEKTIANEVATIASKEETLASKMQTIAEKVETVAEKSGTYATKEEVAASMEVISAIITYM